MKDFAAKLTSEQRKIVLEWGKNKGQGKWSNKKIFEEYNKSDPTTRLRIRNKELTGKGFSTKPGAIKPLSPENAKLFAKTNPGEVWGKGNFSTYNQRGNWLIDAPRKREILKKTKGLITEAELSKILTKELGEDITPTKINGRYGQGQVTEFGKVAQGLSKGTFGSIAGGKDVGGSLKYYRNPNAADIKKFKTAMENFNVGLLKSKTVENILELDKEYSQVYRDGNLPLIEDVVKKTNIKPTEAGYATAKLAQIYSGHKFKNPELNNIRKNINAGNKIFDKMSKAPFGDVYRSGLYDAALETIDLKLGRKKGTFASLKSEARKILADNNFKGFNINEIAGVAGSSKSGAEFSQFIDIMEENLNQKTFASFQSALSRARDGIIKNPENFETIAKKFNKTATIFEDRYNINLPKIIRPEDVTKTYGTKRLEELKKQGLDLVEAAKRDKYGIQVAKGSPTLMEFVNKAKALYNKAPDGAPIRKYLEKNIAHCAKGCFVKVANKNPKRIAKKLSEDPKLIEIFRNEVLAKKPPAVDPASTIKWNPELGVFVNKETGAVVNQEQLKAWAADNPMPVQAGTSVKPGLLRKTGRALAHLGLPLPTAALDTYFIGRQIEEGRDATEIAKDPFNWLGLATMEPLTKAAGMADKSGKMASAMRLWMSPGMIRGATRFLGLPGLALSTGLTAYDQYKKYQNKEGFVYDLFNKEEIDNTSV